MTDCPFDPASQTALLTLLTTLNERQDAIATLLNALCSQQNTLNQSLLNLSDRLTILENQTLQTDLAQPLNELNTQLSPLPTSLATLHDGMNQCVTYSRSFLVELRRFTRTKQPKRPAQSLQDSLNSLQRIVQANTQVYLNLLQQLQQPDPNLQQSLETLATVLQTLQEQLNSQTRSIVSLTQSIEQWQNITNAPLND